MYGIVTGLGQGHPHLVGLADVRFSVVGDDVRRQPELDDDSDEQEQRGQQHRSGQSVPPSMTKAPAAAARRGFGEPGVETTKAPSRVAEGSVLDTHGARARTYCSKKVMPLVAPWLAVRAGQIDGRSSPRSVGGFVTDLWIMWHVVAGAEFPG
jgi:hypothetical protein